MSGLWLARKFLDGMRTGFKATLQTAFHGARGVLSSLLARRTRSPFPPALVHPNGAGQRFFYKGHLARVPLGSPCARARRRPTVSPLMIPLVYCHINSFQRASSVEKPLPGGEKRIDGRAAHHVELSGDW